MSLFRCALSKTLIGAILLMAPSIVSAQQGNPSFMCPDDGQINSLVSNAAGTTDKTLDVDPSGNDNAFTVEVYKASDGTILDTLTFEDGQERSIVVPPGAKARIKDPQDSNAHGPQGTYNFHN